MKHTEAIPDLRAVNQDKKNILFSVSMTNFPVNLSIVCEIKLQWWIYIVGGGGATGARPLKFDRLCFVHLILYKNAFKIGLR